MSFYLILDFIFDLSFNSHLNLIPIFTEPPHGRASSLRLNTTLRPRVPDQLVAIWCDQRVQLVQPCDPGCRTNCNGPQLQLVQPCDPWCRTNWWQFCLSGRFLGRGCTDERTAKSSSNKSASSSSGLQKRICSKLKFKII